MPNNALTYDPFRNTIDTRDPSIQSLEHSIETCTRCKIAAIGTVRCIEFTSTFSMRLAAMLTCAGGVYTFTPSVLVGLCTIVRVIATKRVGSSMLL